jgi:hypothetical protein
VSSDLVAWLRREELWNAVTGRECDFLLSKKRTVQQDVDATWRAEAIIPLLWSLGLISDVPSPKEVCDVRSIENLLPPLFESVREFISSAELRSDSKIYNANEEIFHIHWEVRDAQLSKKPVSPGQLSRMPVPSKESNTKYYNASVVQERHYALNWLIGYCGQHWDEITTDT